MPWHTYINKMTSLPHLNKYYRGAMQIFFYLHHLGKQSLNNAGMDVQWPCAKGEMRC